MSSGQDHSQDDETAEKERDHPDRAEQPIEAYKRLVLTHLVRYAPACDRESEGNPAQEEEKDHRPLEQLGTGRHVADGARARGEDTQHCEPQEVHEHRAVEYQLGEAMPRFQGQGDQEERSSRRERRRPGRTDQGLSDAE